MALRKQSFAPGEFYHLYNRGTDKRIIFANKKDYEHFLFLMYVCNTTKSIELRNVKEDFDREEIIVDIGSYCLMPNHFHILIHEKIEGGISKYMLKLMTSYSMYFNKKYRHTGKLYEGAFLAARIDNDAYLWQVSRYIHLNPIDAGYDFQHYKYSSIEYFTGNKRASWMHSERLVETEHDRQEYLEFVSDYETMHKDMKYLKNILAAQS